jgi:pyruvate kinase
MRRAKIVCTIGPATASPEKILELVEAGMDVARLNMSHGDQATHAAVVERIRDAAAKTGRSVGILVDLQGPKIRLGTFAEGSVLLREGDAFVITTDDVVGTREIASTTYSGLAGDVQAGDLILIDDGRVCLRAISVEGSMVRTMVLEGGRISDHKGINLPGVPVSVPAMSEKDHDDLRWALKAGIDWVALSFVRNADDFDVVQAVMTEVGISVPVIAKIEKPQAADAIESVVAAANGGIMIARGDLGIEVPLSRVPVLQKHLIRAAGHESKPVITATQMLASMVHAKRPTRAEVTDVATAIYDGTDAVMLSEETAVGDHPVEAVKVMDQIARATEPDLPYWEWLLNRTSQEEMDVSASVTQSAVVAAYRLDLKSIVVPTATGRTAVVVAAHRPKVPVLAVTHTLKAVRRLRLVFGVEPVLYDQVTEIRDLLYTCADVAVAEGAAQSGDLIAIVAGLTDQRLGTNLFEVHRVP